MESGNKVRALGLISGGLDSMLAARLIMEQGIEVTGISFSTPFFSSSLAEEAARRIGFPLFVRDIAVPHLAMVKAPRSGYGSHMNPCIDCHALMLQIAGRVLEEERHDFLFTGEVLNERPMSQNLRALNRVANLAGLKGRVLRPLSARLLAETLPEREGLVDRSRLLDIQGRSRRRQVELAKRFDIRDYPTPAGGCLLTDPVFSSRLRDLLQSGPEAGVRTIEMLKFGRYFRLRDGVIALVGRDAITNRTLDGLAGTENLTLRTPLIPGPVVVVCGGHDANDRVLAARLCARYSDHGHRGVRVVASCGSETSEHDVDPLTEEDLSRMRR